MAYRERKDARRSTAADKYFRMNWSISIIILQLLGQVLSDFKLSCIVKNWNCSERIDNTALEMNYGSSALKADLIDSSITIICDDPVQWERSFDQINITRLSYSGCSWDHPGIQSTNYFLGISQVENIILMNSKFNGSLTRFYLSNLETVKKLEISRTINLKLTNESFEGISKLTKLSLRSNGIKEIPNGVFKPLTYLEVLDLGQNEISEINQELFYSVSLKHLNLDGNSLKTLSLNVPSLKYLDVSKNKLESIIINNLNKLVNLSLNHNFLIKMLNGPFKNTSIESIRFNNGNFTIPNEFLTNLECLRYVRLESLKLTEVPENMIWNSSNITELSLASNSLKKLPEKFFLDSTKMKVLNLSKNKIEKINYGLLKPLKQLEKLDLSHNMIVQIESASLSLSKLKVLSLSHNNINNLLPNYLFSFENLPVVETIDLSYNKLNNFDQEWLILMTLNKINLANNNFTFLGVENIQFVSRNAEVDLRSNPLQFIDLSHLDEFARAQEKQINTKPRKIYLSGNEFVCDCHNYEFAKFLHRKMESFVYNELEIDEDLECRGSKTKFSKINTDSLTCNWDLFEVPNKTYNCSSGCQCSYRPHDNSALMDCSNKQLNLAPEKIISSQNINYTELDLSNNFITTLPDYKQLNIRKLNVSHNNITTIKFTELPQDLVELYLENNNLKTISEMNLTHMLTGLKHITMRNNSWDCDCDRGKNTFFFIKKYSSKIDDLSDITCAYPSFQSNILAIEQICPNNIMPIEIVMVMVVAIFLAIFGVLLALYKSYKTEITIWLYSHNITWPISEEYLDQDKEYDAFISYSSEDLEFVSKHLVPGLENGNMPFKLCLHYRDWVIGDFIPAQIARSVDESRRTIIVLSKNYLSSVWGRTEFRTAYSCALNERRSRLIVILYGEISTEDLDPELKTYLSMNTYIKWGDNWFWEKLRYALPHRSDTTKKTRTKIIIPDKLNPLKLI